MIQYACCNGTYSSNGYVHAVGCPGQAEVFVSSNTVTPLNQNSDVNAKLDRIIELLQSLSDSIQEEAQATRDCIRNN